jgi:Uma2 family endonuclease
MTTATIPPAAFPPPSARPKLTDLVNYLDPGQRLLLTGVDYSEFEQLTEWRDEARRWAIRLAFDHGKLEIMVNTNTHERFRKIIALLIEVWLVETGGRYVPSGQLTHKREDLDQGFEPDECYYIQNCDKVIGVREIDFTQDPPPDLAVEAEVSRTVLERLPLYAGFKIPEIWRYDGDRLIVLLLKPDGSYQESITSRALPNLPLSELSHFLEMATHVDYATITREFKSWIRTLPPVAPKS